MGEIPWNRGLVRQGHMMVAIFALIDSNMPEHMPEGFKECYATFPSLLLH